MATSGGFRGRVSIFWKVDGIDQYISYITTSTEKELPLNMQARAARYLRDLNSMAEKQFYSSIVRTSKPRPGSAKHLGREKFTFGGSGAAFRGVLIDSKTKGGRGFPGWGYPDMQNADAKTKGVWRTAEFGLGALADLDRPGGAGVHKLPFAYGFRNARGWSSKRWFSEDEQLYPFDKDTVPDGGGVMAMRFLRTSIQEFLKTPFGRDYQAEMARAFRVGVR